MRPKHLPVPIHDLLPHPCRPHPRNVHRNQRAESSKSTDWKPALQISERTRIETRLSRSIPPHPTFPHLPQFIEVSLTCNAKTEIGAERTASCQVHACRAVQHLDQSLFQHSWLSSTYARLLQKLQTLQPECSPRHNDRTRLNRGQTVEDDVTGQAHAAETGMCSTLLFHQASSQLPIFTSSRSCPSRPHSSISPHPSLTVSAAR